MTPGGWLFLALSWTLIIGVCAFCIYRVLRGKKA